MAGQRVAFWWGDWWGSTEAIVRCERPADLPHELRQTDKVLKLVKQVAELQGLAKPAELGPPKPERDNAGRPIQVRPLPLDPPWGVNVAYIAFAERYAKPEGWQRVILRGGELLVLIGIRSDQEEPVALVAGGRWP